MSSATSTKTKPSTTELSAIASPQPSVQTQTRHTAQSDSLPLVQASRRWPKVVGYCLALTSTILLGGYYSVVIGNVVAVPSFQQYFGEKHGNEWTIPAMWLSLWIAASPIGATFGGAVGGIVQDLFGRRFAIGSGSLLSAIAVAICFVSDLPTDINSRRGLFVVGRFASGFATTVLLCAVQTWMSEIAPKALRGPVLALFPIFTLLGQLTGAIVVRSIIDLDNARSYRTCFGSAWPFAVVPFMLAFFLPESPTWLVRKERKAAALKAQSRLDESAEDTGANVNELQQSIELEEKQRRTRAATYNSCFKGTDARRTMIVVFANVLPQLFGLTLLGQATYFMQVVGMSHHNSALFLIIGIALGLLANLISIWAVSVTGRRSLMLWSLAGAGVLWLGMGITGCFGNDIVTWYTAVTMIIIITVCGVGVWPVSYVVGGETSSLHLRGKTQGIGWLAQGLSNAVFGAVLPYIFSADQGDLKAKTGFVYAGLCAVAVLITWAAVPEMRGRSAMEIDKMFSEGVPARRFRSWPDDADLGTPDLV